MDATCVIDFLTHLSLSFGIMLFTVQCSICIVVFTRCVLLNLKCSELNFGRGSSLDPTVGIHSSSNPDFLVGFWGAVS